MISFFLALLLLFIWCIPSGPPCPKCGSHATAMYKSPGHYFQISGMVCFSCKHKWGDTMTKEKKK